MARGTAKKTVRRKKGISYSKWGYIFVTPFIVAYLIFSLYPLLTTFIYSSSNMKSTVADFWGFDNKDVYYDRYLNLNELYSEDFDERTGVDSKAYKRIREYFDKFQSNADTLDPLNEEGIKAIVDYANSGDGADKYSVESANAAQAAFDNQDFSYIIGEPYDDLVNWFSNYKDETMLNLKTLSSVKGKLDSITETQTSDDEGASTEDQVTEESFIESDEFVEFVASLKDTEFNPAQQALLDYLSGYLTSALGEDYTVESYFDAVAEGKVSITDPTFYYTCYTLSKTKIDFAEEGSDEKILSPIDVPFMSTLESFLSENSWKDMINSLNSYSALEDYIKGEKDLHDDEEQLYADLKNLQAAGIINIVPLVKDGDAIVESEDYTENKLVALRRFIDSKYESNPTALKAAAQISAIKNFGDLTTEGGSPEKFKQQGVENIYAMIDYNGNVDFEKYRQVKEAVGLTDALSYDSYVRLDNERKQANIEKAQAMLDENNALLPDAQATYDTAKAGGDEKEIKKAYEELRKVENNIAEAKETISNPNGILYKVNSKQLYIFTGLENYRQIFNSKTRLDNVVGSFFNTAILWVIGFLPQIGLALLLSAWFTDKKIKLKGLGLMKGLMYLPNIITSVTIAVFFRKIFMYSNGGNLSASQIFLRNVVGMKDGYNFFESVWATRFIICFINFWMWYGNTMITLIAGITSISESLYESAQIDGVNSFQTYTKITLPLLRPMLLYTMVTSMIGGLQMFDIPQYINQNPPRVNFNGTMIQSTRTVLMYVNKLAFGPQYNKQVGIACATSVLLFFTTTVLSLIVFYIMRDKDAAKAKKLAKKGAKKNG